jgi:cytoskeleton protein RodZ
MMEHLPENNPRDDQPAARQTATTGSILRAAREKLGLTVAEVAGQIKFAPRQIEALEADDYKHLPEVAFLRGFVRSYAKILRLDAEALLANLPQSKAVVPDLTPAPVQMTFPSDQAERQQNLIWLSAAGLLALIVVGFSYWHFKSPPRHAKEVVKEQVKQQSIELPREQAMELPREQAAESPNPQSTEQSEATQPEVPVERSPGKKMVDEPLVLKSSTIEPSVRVAPKPRPSAAASSVKETKTQAAKHSAKSAPAVSSASSIEASGAMTEVSELLLVFGEESWTEIKDKDGKILSSQVNSPGSELRVQGNPPFSMLIGHAASASLFYQGREVDLKPYINKYSEVAHLTLQ